LSGESPFWPDWNGVEWRKLLLARHELFRFEEACFLPEKEWLGMEEVDFGLTIIAWKRGSQFWPDWNGLDWQKSVLA
jgi:hypothetical protein